MSHPPFTLVGLDHVVFLVDDMVRAVTFYREVLGCVDGYNYPALGMEQVWCGASLIVLWDITHPGAASAVPPISGGRNVDHVCIATSPFPPEAMRAHLLTVTDVWAPGGSESAIEAAMHGSDGKELRRIG